MPVKVPVVDCYTAHGESKPHSLYTDEYSASLTVDRGPIDSLALVFNLFQAQQLHIQGWMVQHMPPRTLSPLSQHSCIGASPSYWEQHSGGHDLHPAGLPGRLDALLFACVLIEVAGCFVREWRHGL
jgi:hypothetical protein